MTLAPIWTPDPDAAAASHMARFAQRHGFAGNSAGYAAMHAWSVQDREAFWRAAADYCGLRFTTAARAVVENGDAMPGAHWFPGAKLNFARQALDNDLEGPAIVFANEHGDHRTLAWKELRMAVAGVAEFLRQSGIGQGDRVAGVLPNLPETVIATLAAASVGATWASCSPDFGEAALIDRLGQVAPKLLFGTGAYYYNGRKIDCLPVLRRVCEQLPTVETVIVERYADPAPDLTGLPDAVAFDAIGPAAGPASYADVPFDHPLYILFSSGTTGAPKCLVHGTGGTLLQHLKEHQLHTNVSPGDRLFYFTTCGWMMWNWLVSGLASGATLVLFDGSPFHPDPGVLWRLADDVGIDIFGTSAKYLSALEQSAYAPREHHRLDRLRTILSTGSPLAPASFEFSAASIGPQIQLSSIAGGTDIVSCFMLGNPLLPVYPGEIQCPGLGMDVRIYSPDGEPMKERKGELVCAAPFPSMPIGFLGDDGTAYRRAYFERFPNVWCHGDFAELTARNGIVIHGRSDAVLNPGGVRIGTAEIYRVVEAMDEIDEAVAIGQEWGGDTRVVLFVTVTGNRPLDETLASRIRTNLRSRLSPRHVPAVIAPVSEIPRTINGKVSELAVRDVVHGRPVANLSALANPDALEQFRDRAELGA